MKKLLPHSLHQLTKLTLITALILGFVSAAFYLAGYVEQHDTAKEIVNQFGYVGVIVVALVAGLNAVVPVPAATFVPVFLAAGLTMPLIIVSLVIGTTIADLIGYQLGRWGKRLVSKQYPRTHDRIQALQERHRKLLIPFVFCYSAFVPFPNEAIMIPLALSGVHLRIFIIPLVLGTVINQSLLAYGVNNIFLLLL